MIRTLVFKTPDSASVFTYETVLATDAEALRIALEELNFTSADEYTVTVTPHAVPVPNRFAYYRGIAAGTMIDGYKLSHFLWVSGERPATNR